MASGLFVSDCSSSDWAWLDLGCGVQAVGADLGTGVGSLIGNAISPLLTPLVVIGIFILLLVVIIGFAPNVKHIVPHIGLN
jgi:hypothetical protein